MATQRRRTVGLAVVVAALGLACLPQPPGSATALPAGPPARSPHRPPSGLVGWRLDSLRLDDRGLDDRQVGPPRGTPAGPAPATPPAAGPTGAGGCPARSGAVVRQAPGSDRTVALTFDDGPGPWTAGVLHLLLRYRVPATFFVIGQQVAADPATVRRIVTEGHLLGNHSWSHRYPRAFRGGWSAGYLRAQISRTDQQLRAVTGIRTCWFRPPGGFMQSVPGAARAEHKAIALWSVDTLDWRVQRDVTADPTGSRRRFIVSQAVAGGREPHPVVLMHDGGGWRGATLSALPAIIQFYRARGYRFVRLDGR